MRVSTDVSIGRVRLSPLSTSCYNIVPTLTVMNCNKYRNICSIHSLSQVVDLETLLCRHSWRRFAQKSETSEAISETDVEESEESKGSSKNTFRSYHGTTEHYDSESD